MAFRMLLIFVLISMFSISSIQSSPLSDDYLLENDASSVNPSSAVIIHPYNFISLICQQPEQYPMKMIRKICSNYLPSDKIQDQQQQQRGKRVGWTISV